MSETKVCIGCGIEKDLLMFNQVKGKHVKSIRYLCRCKECQKIETRNQYLKNREKRLARCKEYRKEVNADDNRKNKRNARVRGYYHTNREYGIYNRTKNRAKRHNIPFDIDVSDIVIPDVCPILGIPLCLDADLGRARFNSPSLDRIIPSKGYVKGNICIISQRANTLKNDGNADEHRKIAEYIEKNGG